MVVSHLTDEGRDRLLDTMTAVREEINAYVEEHDMNDIREATSEWLHEVAESVDAEESGLYDSLDGNWETEQEWRSYLNERFEDTAVQAAEHSPRWAEYFEDGDLSSFDLFEDALEMTESDDVRSNQPPETDDFRMALDVAQGNSVFLTSGTTGVPKSYFYSKDDWDRDILEMGTRTLELAGIDEEDVVANYFPKTGTNLSGPAVDAASKERGTGVLSFAEDCDPVKQYEGMEQYDVSVVAGLTTQVEALARQMEADGLDMSELGIEKVIVAGEFSTEEKRDWIADRFEADEVVDFYGSTEFGFSGIESEEGNMNFYEDQLYIAAYDEDGNKLEDGEEGLLVFTYLKDEDHEMGMPSFGFAIGDHGRVVERHKNVEGYPVTEVDVYGKAEDEFTVGAVDLRPSFFEESVREVAEKDAFTGEYQIVIDQEIGEAEELTLYVEAEEEGQQYKEELRNYILDSHVYLQDTIEKGAVEFEIGLEEDIGFEPGKPQRVIDKRYDEQEE
jgi:phenylacetate-coenzyme A ligase PaaK-like adenylate-forming protein